ncbi:LpqB family beta-propeller domain-containing protein [Cellulosimicrobium marinum]|uniref:LpqB family beta-propeller domain-containing protein n=1 Tax=Cellulosimicrobium marinum TaxID=1638992 RepID=UPI001E398A0A|nr:LpqB family beta-propeller domain-containing protein [Cellulosimicrobium marinum]MCB7137228.1 LpqB family beta-propeller domain-containing protein [Cellulosimicrobium marinum]
MTTTSSRRAGLVLRRARAALAAVATLALVGTVSACTSIPTQGPVMDGEAVVSQPGPAFVRADAPREDASPEQIVRGFLAAQAQGGSGSFDVATQFLTPETASTWSPLAQVAVLETEPELQVDESTVDDGAVTVRATADVAGVVDEHGVYTEQLPGATTELVYGLVLDEDGQWRVETTDDGVAISVTNFDTTYRETNLYFPTVDRRYLVPDERWFPQRTWQTFAVREMLAGPVPWLAGAVTTVAPEGTALSIDSVVPDGTGPIQVSLTGPAAEAGPEDRGLLVAQLEASLGDPSPREVQIVVDGAPLVAEDSTARAAVTPNDAVVLAEGQVMSLVGRTTEPLESVAPLTGLQPTALAFTGASSDATLVVRDASDRIVTAPTEDAPSATLLAGEDLLAPSVDRFGLVWSGPQVQAGSVQVVDLEARVREVAAPWLEGRTVMSLRVAPDGARVAVVSATASGVQVHVAGVVRDEDGWPVELTEPVRVGQPLVAATQVVWVDRTLLGVLGRSDGDSAPVVHLVPVGGHTSKTSPLEDAVSLAAASGVGSMLLGTSDGSLFAASSSSLWTRVATEVRLPTYPG